MIRLLSIVSLIFCFSFAFAAFSSDKTVITGEEMEIRKSGEVTVSRGNSKAVNGKSIIESDTMTYNKTSRVVDASGNVKLYSETDDNEPVNAYGDFAEYSLESDKGKLWGKKSLVKYFMKSSEKPLVLNAKKINLDRNLEMLSAYENVVIVTSSGTITADNAVFDKKTDSVLMVKDEKRPVADVAFDGRKGLYEADEMVFFNADDKKKIVMTGTVTGVIEMEDKIQ